MDHLLQFQKLCQLDTRRLLLLMGVVFAAVLMFQSSTLPYGNALLSLFPSGKIPILGKSSFSSRDSIPEAEMVDKSISLTDSAHSKGNNTKANDTGKENDDTNDRKSKDQIVSGSAFNDSSFENVFRDKNFTREDVGSPDSGSSPEKARAPAPSLSKDQIRQSISDLPFNNAQSHDSRLAEGPIGIIVTSISSIPPALPPVLSSDDLTLLSKSAENSSVSIMSVSPNISPVATQGTGTLLKNESPSLLQSGAIVSNASKTMTDSSVVSKGWEQRTPIFKLNSLLLQSHASVHSMRPLWSSKCDHELLSAKSQISNAPIAVNDQELYPSIFRNVSMFKRSYELMEELLKVYIYSEGEKPIFHEPTEPILKGIYSSEGWFMRQMEKNKQFVVKDPTKAHLFYLPFSSRMLQLQLYVRNSHSRTNLAEYMKNYVNMIATKYPFWNRTSGADHFLVACHDWAPFETRGRMNNCIKVLCNANIARDFKIGKDATLPTTQVRKVEDPLRGLGGNPPSERPILAFFAGGMHGSLRPTLLQYWGNKHPDMKIYGSMPQGATMNYVQHMKSSKYCICPRGYDVNSPRVFEAIFHECVPVIIADDYVPPFFEVLNWEAFAVFVPEKDVSHLRDVLLSITEEKYLEMHLRVKRVQRHFLWNMEPIKYDIFHMILHSVWFNRLNRV